jgi:glutathione S-transferase
LPAGDVVDHDSLAIIEYVNEKMLGGRGWPSAARARALARAISAEMHSGFSALRSELPMNVKRTGVQVTLSPQAHADQARILEIWRTTRKTFGATGPYLFGAWSAADAMFAPVCSRFVTYVVELDGDALAYRDSILALPAMQEWMAAARAEREAMPKYDAIGT